MIDWCKIRELMDEIGDSDFPDVARMFLSDTDAAIARLGATQNIGDALHYIKGSALTMGFSELATLCQLGENAASAGAPVDLDALRSCFERSRDRFLGEFPRRLRISLPPDAA